MDEDPGTPNPLESAAVPPSTADVFVSYAWTSDVHREWVRLLVAQLRMLGYSVLVDEDVDYGDSLSGFMRDAVNAAHVLMIVDKNYAERADTLPHSGVGIENGWIRSVRETRRANWLAAVFVRNAGFRLPHWLTDDNPKSFDFNADVARADFPGVTQIESLWRWMQGLPAGRQHATSLATLRGRATRLERVEIARDPNAWATPELAGQITFRYTEQTRSCFTIGHGEFQFVLKVGTRGADSIYVLNDYVEAVGLITADHFNRADTESFIRSGRFVEPHVGQSVVLMNEHGALCIVHIEDVQLEVNGPTFTPAHVGFTFEVLIES